MDVAFAGHTAYVLVTLVGPALGQEDVVNGLYRVERNGSVTAVADIGEWSIDNPPGPAFFVPSGVQYALQEYGGGFLVTDGHHNRVLHVTRRGHIRELIAFGNIVPTGLEVHGWTIYRPGRPDPASPAERQGREIHAVVGSDRGRVGASLIVDVEFGPDRRLYALSQGIWDLPQIPENEGAPASANTGKLLRITRDGSFAAVFEPIDRPTSLEFIGKTAFVITLTGKVVRIDNVGRSHFG